MSALWCVRLREISLYSFIVEPIFQLWTSVYFRISKVVLTLGFPNCFQFWEYMLRTGFSVFHRHVSYEIKSVGFWYLVVYFYRKFYITKNLSAIFGNIVGKFYYEWYQRYFNGKYLWWYVHCLTKYIIMNWTFNFAS